MFSYKMRVGFIAVFPVCLWFLLLVPEKNLVFYVPSLRTYYHVQGVSEPYILLNPVKLARK